MENYVKKLQEEITLVIENQSNLEQCLVIIQEILGIDENAYMSAEEIENYDPDPMYEIVKDVFHSHLTDVEDIALTMIRDCKYYYVSEILYSEVLNTFGLPVPSDKEVIEEDLKLINSFLELPEKGFLEKVEKHFKM